MDIDVALSANSIKLINIYRPPPSKKNRRSYAEFLFEFAGFVEHYALMTCHFAIVGDFNIHWDVQSDNSVKRFTDLLESVNIIQHVQVPKHIDGHTIDLILTLSENHGITSTKTSLLLSDTCGWNVLSTWRNQSFRGKRSYTESIKALTRLRFIMISLRRL